MAKLNVMLLVIVVLTGLYTVQVQYESRRLFTALDRATAEHHKLETDNARLTVEKRAEATSLRVESLAKTKLNMRVATPAMHAAGSARGHGQHLRQDQSARPAAVVRQVPA